MNLNAPQQKPSGTCTEIHLGLIKGKRRLRRAGWVAQRMGVGLKMKIGGVMGKMCPFSSIQTGKPAELNRIQMYTWPVAVAKRFQVTQTDSL